jgi:hypothetical protein
MRRMFFLNRKYRASRARVQPDFSSPLAYAQRKARRAFGWKPCGSDQAENGQLLFRAHGVDLYQSLRDLHRVGGGPFAQVVGYDP